MKICPKCNRVVELDSNLDRYVCTSCSWRSEKRDISNKCNSCNGANMVGLSFWLETQKVSQNERGLPFATMLFICENCGNVQGKLVER